MTTCTIGQLNYNLHLYIYWWFV